MGEKGLEKKKTGGLSADEKCLLGLLRRELTGRCGQEGFSEGPSGWGELFALADRHGVAPLLYQSLTEEASVPDWLRQQAAEKSRQTVRQSYRLLFLSRFLIRNLEEAGIPVALLKGAGTAGFYPVPELRKSGDVDLLLLEPHRAQEAGAVLEGLGCVMQPRQPALHHIVYQSPEGIEVELHTMLAEPFDHRRVNAYIQEKHAECREHIVRKEVMGVELPILDTAYHAYGLLLHMLQHFLRSGFGLKLLCDWTVLWNRETKAGDRDRYLELVTGSGVKGFSDMVTLACTRYLGLGAESVEWMGLRPGYGAEQFLREVLDAEEFGRSAPGRMVALRGSAPVDYMREFHHQMRLNFPKKGRCALFWPVLWTITLIRFLRNNRRVRGTSARVILARAGERGRAVSRMELFRMPQSRGTR